MFFDRYEIHIQALVGFIHGKLIIFNPPLRKNIFKICTQQITRKSEQKRETNRTIWYPGHTDFGNFRNFESPILTNIIFSKDDSIFVLVFCEAFW